MCYDLSDLGSLILIRNMHPYLCKMYCYHGPHARIVKLQQWLSCDLWIKEQGVMMMMIPLLKCPKL